MTNKPVAFKFTIFSAVDAPEKYAKTIVRNTAFTIGLGDSGDLDLVFVYHELDDIISDAEILELQENIGDTFKQGSVILFHPSSPPNAFTQVVGNRAVLYEYTKVTPEIEEVIHDIVCSLAKSYKMKYKGFYIYSAKKLLN